MSARLPRQHVYRSGHGCVRSTEARHPSQWDLDPEGWPALERLAGLPHWASACRIVSSTELKAVRTAECLARRNRLPPPEAVSALGERHKGSVVPNHAGVVVRLFRFPSQPAAQGWETVRAALAASTTRSRRWWRPPGGGTSSWSPTASCCRSS
ncbi:hypothetical protein STH1016 [Symbiobacterium thermophilum IAM 14863]|uniref:Uncharacterized protein n=1 Tax=Symbiobacterium thermophilum (strain DSM 24528 / JCM 14929 / IAM 14863 / T) TaxID=292459 RepID=Q67QP2_SYMTH|nr:hypothetical protein STH1016 [Symbiobacterium thermophilum IAM 14863]